DVMSENMLRTNSSLSTTLDSTEDIHADFFFQAEDGIRDRNVTGVQTCALPILIPSSTLQDGQLGVKVDEGIIVVDKALQAVPERSEERRVGKECRSRGAPYH